MKTNEIARIIEGHGKLTRAVEEALASDKMLIDEGDRWLPRLWASDIDYMDINAVDQTLVGHGTVYTMQTGGSIETLGFTIPLETLRKFL